MKRFRKITALALAVAVVAMFGISASAAGSSVNLNGDFGTGAIFSWGLTSNVANATATFHGAEDNNIQIADHRIQISCSYFDGFGNLRSGNGERRNQLDYVFASVAVNQNCRITNATYRYDVAYITSDDVYCTLFHGPVMLTNASQ